MTGRAAMFLFAAMLATVGCGGSSSSKPLLTSSNGPTSSTTSLLKQLKNTSTWLRRTTKKWIKLRRIQGGRKRSGQTWHKRMPMW